MAETTAVPTRNASTRNIGGGSGEGSWLDADGRSDDR
jgi:hypothetical protein